ncbi:MAG TPA: two-component regulator propeller domain-containing protein [Lunatimonas sp.]|nr:two-component regulator propeller domain-containing protein [Lunatimonas sp.]
MTEITFSSPLSVIQIFVDRSDRVWCARSGGYALYQNNNWTYDEETFKEISVFAIAQAPDGTIWLGTGDGVYLLMM